MGWFDWFKSKREEDKESFEAKEDVLSYIRKVGKQYFHARKTESSLIQHYLATAEQALIRGVDPMKIKKGVEMKIKQVTTGLKSVRVPYFDFHLESKQDEEIARRYLPDFNRKMRENDLNRAYDNWVSKAKPLLLEIFTKHAKDLDGLKWRKDYAEAGTSYKLKTRSDGRFVVQEGDYIHDNSGKGYSPEEVLFGHRLGGYETDKWTFIGAILYGESGSVRSLKF